jgi:hypothetical protein
MGEYVQQIYKSQADLVNDIREALRAIDEANQNREIALGDLRRIIAAKYTIEVDIANAFKKWQFAYLELREKT